MQLPENYELIFSKEEILQRTQKLANDISSWLKSNQKSKKDLLAVCTLRGAVPFFSELIRAIDASVEPAYIRAFSYSSKTNEQEQDVLVEPYQIHVADRDVLIVDDICDSGATLKEMKKVLLEAGALQVESAVLLRRVIDNPKSIPTWVGFEHDGPEWFVGFGMEDKNRFANLPAIYTIKN